MKFTRLNFPINRLPVRFAASAFAFSTFLSVAHADLFPSAYVSKNLEEARRNISVDIRNLNAGEMLSVQFMDRTIFIYRRTPSDIKSLEKDKRSAIYLEKAFRESIRHEFGSSSSTAWARLLISAKKISTSAPFRSLNPDVLVISAASPATGCLLRLISVKDRAIAESVFLDPCSKISYDAAGSPLNSNTTSTKQFVDYGIAIPPYYFEKERLHIGLVKGQQIPELPFSHEELIGSGTSTQRLIAAAKYNDIDAVRAAIKDGANVNHFRIGEGSPIDAAIIGSSSEIIELLVREGAKPTINSENAARFVGRNDVLTLLKSIK